MTASSSAPRNAGKHAERRVARALGGKRLPSIGSHQSDVVNVWMGIEVKYRKKLPIWLTKAIQQTIASTNPNSLPAVVLLEKHQQVENGILLLRIKDFKQWFGWNRPNGKE